MNLQERMKHVENRIQQACDRSGRERGEIRIVAVTKYVSLEATREAAQAGLLHIGENRWQDAQAKWEAIGGQASWHFLGHLQTNKVKEVVGRFHYIHSLDRLSLAKELHKKAEAIDTAVNCFIQVNVSGEESKYGLSPEELSAFAEQCAQYDRLNLIGLMTMAPYEAEPEATRPVFAGLRKLRDELNASGILKQPMLELSMGMSNDYEVAVEEGATWLRLGTILVGKEEG
ncbi:hypothetical protein SY83_15120 [Paenibacillus swuensis]|uniref:Pyridoxal phosphate homeostasis protein n=1 Tax=Paenibacillus swuensis TaxID=1178515 RepID=A0A172TK12_9BACL|nr:YggS family pyridoxal phosphate-dependent enzyme [Paenibacillus swuensis]ANE47381.1 hypothetical protein SY83_15120 [Paenibacillus swuensis]